MEKKELRSGLAAKTSVVPADLSVRKEVRLSERWVAMLILAERNQKRNKGQRTLSEREPSTEILEKKKKKMVYILVKCLELYKVKRRNMI